VAANRVTHIRCAPQAFLANSWQCAFLQSN
jgi:hypothetical protein